MAPPSFVLVLTLFLAFTAHVSAQSFNYTKPYGSLSDCVNTIYPEVQEYLCTYYKICNANLCNDQNNIYYEWIVYACEFLSDGGDLDKSIKDKCKAAAGSSKPQAGAIAGGVVGGVAGVAAIGAIGAIAYHMLVSPVPALTHLGMAGAGAAGAASGAAHGASGAAHGAAAAGHAAHAAHAGHAASAGQAGAQGGTQMAQHGTGVASAGHTLGTGTGPYMGDGGAGHAMGQGAAQAPMGTDGGSTMSGGQSFAPSSSQGFGPGPAHGYAPNVPGQGVYPNPTGSAPIGAGNAPFASDGGASGQGYFGPSFPPVGPDAGAGAGASAGASAGAGQAAAPGYTPTNSIPSPSTSTPSSGVPYGAPPNLPQVERTRWNLFGQSRKSMKDEEAQRLASYPHMAQLPTPSTTGTPDSPMSPPVSFLSQPQIAVGGDPFPPQPPQPSGGQAGVQLQTSIEYTGSPSRTV